MIARPLPAQQEAPIRVGTRAGRTASELRHGRNRRMRYAGVRWITVITTLVTLCVIGYLALLSNVTRMHYEATRIELRRAALQEETQRLDNEIARLSSRDRLATLAARLGMKEAASFSVVNLPAPKAPSQRLSLLSSITGWGR
jgi:cell division protein FtsL